MTAQDLAQAPELGVTLVLLAEVERLLGCVLQIVGVKVESIDPFRMALMAQISA